jgi:hypothetical protein
VLLQQMQPVHQLVLAAFSMLLVWNTEVVAVMAVADLEPSIVDLQDFLPPDTNLHDLTMVVLGDH